MLRKKIANGFYYLYIGNKDKNLIFQYYTMTLSKERDLPMA